MRISTINAILLSTLLATGCSSATKQSEHTDAAINTVPAAETNAQPSEAPAEEAPKTAEDAGNETEKAAPSPAIEENERIFVIQETSKEPFKKVGLKQADSHVKLKLSKPKKYDGLFPEWLERNAIQTNTLPYFDGTYFIEGRSVNTNYDHQMTHLIVTKGKQKTVLDFTDFYKCNESDGCLDFANRCIGNAVIKDNILYVTIRHKTFQKAYSVNAFMLAISLENGEVLWKSAHLTSNAQTFSIVNETIITGYGYTKEPDYLYTLDINTGETIDQIKLDSGPEHIIAKDNKVYIVTYNSEYVADIL